MKHNVSRALPLDGDGGFLINKKLHKIKNAIGLKKRMRYSNRMVP